MALLLSSSSCIKVFNSSSLQFGSVVLTFSEQPPQKHYFDVVSYYWCLTPNQPELPCWPSGKGIRLESRRSRVRIPLAPRFFRGWVTPVTWKLALQWPPCQAPGVLGSVLGLVLPVSVYCDWVRWKVWSATSVSVWQHIQLSRSIPEIHSYVAGTLSNQQTNQSSGTVISRQLALKKMSFWVIYHFLIFNFLIVVNWSEVCWGHSLDSRSMKSDYCRASLNIKLICVVSINESVCSSVRKPLNSRTVPFIVFRNDSDLHLPYLIVIVITAFIVFLLWLLALSTATQKPHPLSCL